MNISKLNLTSKIIGALGVGVTLLDSNSIGVRKAEANAKVGVANGSLRQQIGMSKMDYPSPMYNAIRNDLKTSFPQTLVSTMHGIGGYFMGMYEGVKNNLPLLATSTLAIVASTKALNNKFLQKAGIIGAGLSAGYSLLKNGTSFFENKNYLDK